MSYDIVQHTDGIDDGIDRVDLNYTFNRSDLWYDVFGEEGLSTLSGMTGAEAEAAIVQFLIDVTKKYMDGDYSTVLEEVSKYRSHPENLKSIVGPKTIKAGIREYDSRNGWGSAFCQLNLMLTMLVHSRENPEDTWGIYK